MTEKPQQYIGVVSGRTIELEADPGLVEGQYVTVHLVPRLPPGEGIRRAAGAWADDGPELDEWLAELMRARGREPNGDVR